MSKPLVEKYRPRKLEEFVGLSRVKRILAGLARDPKPLTLLFVGPPGTGKSTAALAMVEELNAGLIDIPAQECTVETVAKAWEDVHYYAAPGKNWWVIRIEEADKMSRQAQIALLSHMDSTAGLSFGFGGEVKANDQPPVIFICTCNGSGSDGCAPPAGLEARFLSRCLVVRFREDDIAPEMPLFLASVWERETGRKPNGEVKGIAAECGGRVRDALQAVELALLEDEPQTQTGHWQYSEARKGTVWVAE